MSIQSHEEIVRKKIQILEQLKSCGYLDSVEAASQMLISCLQDGGKIMLAGNGGSAADAQHFAAEIVGRFLKERSSAAAISLCCDPSIMTSVANDYGYRSVFSRQVEGLGLAGDCLIAISTSGNSDNLIEAIHAARARDIRVIGLLGKGGGSMRELCDISLIVPSDETPRIQEIHTFTVHLLCGAIEDSLF